MKKSIIAAAALAFAIAGCGGGVKASPSGNAGNGTGSPSDGGRTGTLSPYQQQKYDALAQVACYETDGHNRDISALSFGIWINRVETALDLSKADATAFARRVVSKQCPENLGYITQWQKEPDFINLK